MEQQIINSILNTVTFYGEKKKIKQAVAYINGKTGFRNICLGRDIKVTKYGFQSETDWEPNITGVKRIADKFDLNFVMLYDDGVEMFGEVNYSFGEFTIVELDDTDFGKLSLDEKNGMYSYRGETGFEKSDFFNTLLDEKLCDICHSKMTASLQ